MGDGILVDLVLKDQLSDGVKSAIGALGTFKQAFGMLDQALKATAGESVKYANEVAKVATAQRLSTEQASVMVYASQRLGVSVDQLSKTLRTDSEEFERMRQEAQASGLVMSGQAVKAAQDYDQSLKTLEGTVKGLQVEVGNQLIPTLTKATSTLNLLVTWNRRIADATNQHEKAVIQSSDSYEEYRNEMLRAYAASQGMNESTVQGRLYLQALFADAERSARNIGLLSREQHGAQKSMLALIEADKEYQRVADTNIAVLKKNADMFDEMIKARQEAAKVIGDSVMLAIQLGDKERERGKIEQQLLELERQIIKNGPVRTATIKNETLSTEDRRMAELRLMAAKEDLLQLKRGEKETDAEWNLRLAEANARVGDLNTRLGEHKAVLGGATQEQLKQRDALKATLDEMQRVAQIDAAKSAFASLTKALQEGRLNEEEYLAVTKRLNQQVKLYSDDALKAAVTSTLMNKALSDSTGAEDAWKAIMKYGDGLGRAIELEQRLYQGVGAPTQGENRRVGGEAPGGQHGLDMIVPPGYRNDSYYVRASSGEHVRITPSSQVTNTRFGDNVTIIVNDRRQAAMIADMRRSSKLTEQYGS